MIYRQEDPAEGGANSPVPNIKGSMKNLQIEQREVENQLHQYYQNKMMGAGNMNAQAVIQNMVVTETDMRQYGLLPMRVNANFILKCNEEPVQKEPTTPTALK